MNLESRDVLGLFSNLSMEVLLKVGGLRDLGGVWEYVAVM